MKLGIIILNWNGEEMLRRFLPSVIEHSPEAEVVVADNGSTDGSLKMLDKQFPNVRTIVFDRNYGFAEGYNKAIAQGECDLCLLLNSDVRVEEGWLTPMLDYMEQHPEVAACQPKIRCEWQPDMLEYAGACGGYIDRLGFPFCRGRILDTTERDEGQYDSVASVAWATGAALLVRRDIYIKADWMPASLHIKKRSTSAGVSEAVATASSASPRAWPITSEAAHFRRKVLARLTSTSATTCCFSTRICRRKGSAESCFGGVCLMQQQPCTSWQEGIGQFARQS